MKLSSSFINMPKKISDNYLFSPFVKEFFDPGHANNTLSPFLNTIPGALLGKTSFPEFTINGNNWLSFSKL